MKRALKRTLVLLLAVLLLCGAAPLTAGAEDTPYKQGDIIEFGSYPQTEVKDPDLIAALNAASQTWVSYGYYSGTGSYYDGQMTAKDYMQYKDVLLDGIKYRGVKFTQYRPWYTGDTSSAGYSDQDDNGYYIGTTYWFQYEPLYWRVLDPNTGLVLCKTIIDSQPYNNYTLYSLYTLSPVEDAYNEWVYWGDADMTHYANSYAESSLRQWLNDDFYNMAFTAEQQNAIAATTLDNSAYDTSRSAYDNAATTDKVFLLSWNDALNTAYGFDTNKGADDPARQAESSDYANCQGVNVGLNEGSNWWLRSPGITTSCACHVFSGGSIDYYCATNHTCDGVRPALTLNLTPETKKYTAAFMVDGVCVQETKYAEGAAIVKPVDPTKEGYTFTSWSPAVPATMPAQDMTFTAQFQKNEAPQTGKVKSVTASDLSLFYKKDGKLQPVVTTDEGVKYTLAYSGFDSSIISVDANGKATALKKGTTTVTVTVTDENGNTVESKCIVTVKYAWWQVLIRIFLLGFLWY